jgi:hypothetical protein
VVDAWLDEAVELFVHREDAEQMLAEVLADEPHWRGLLWVEPIDLGEFNPN